MNPDDAKELLDAMRGVLSCCQLVDGLATERQAALTLSVSRDAYDYLMALVARIDGKR